jgi:hypothetical protein
MREKMKELTVRMSPEDFARLKRMLFDAGGEQGEIKQQQIGAELFGMYLDGVLVRNTDGTYRMGNCKTTVPSRTLSDEFTSEERKAIADLRYILENDKERAKWIKGNLATFVDAIKNRQELDAIRSNFAVRKDSGKTNKTGSSPDKPARR